MTERICGSCSVCCKLLSVHEINKPKGTWCSHCTPGKGGCMIYQTRPEVCREWKCGWLLNIIPDKYRPDRCGFVIDAFGDHMWRLIVDWKRMRERPRLKQVFRQFQAEAWSLGISTMYVNETKQHRAVLAAGHTEEGLIAAWEEFKRTRLTS